MRSFCKRALAAMAGLGLAVMTTAPAYADVGVGDTAPLFDTVNEDLDPVSMAELIDANTLSVAKG